MIAMCPDHDGSFQKAFGRPTGQDQRDIINKILATVAASRAVA